MDNPELLAVKSIMEAFGHAHDALLGLERTRTVLAQKGDVLTRRDLAAISSVEATLHTLRKLEISLRSISAHYHETKNAHQELAAVISFAANVASLHRLPADADTAVLRILADRKASRESFKAQQR